MILNLFLNAADAMSDVEDRPRQLVIKTEPEKDERVRLTVQDTGVSFDPQNAERLFEMFYTTKSNGMGIGLPVSRAIIENHQGRLWAASERRSGSHVLIFDSLQVRDHERSRCECDRAATATLVRNP